MKYGEKLQPTKRRSTQSIDHVRDKDECQEKRMQVKLILLFKS